MRASQTQRSQPVPLPLPLPPPPLCLPSPHAAPRRGRHRSSYSSSSSSSSSVSSAASSTFCPSPSPAASPLGRSSSSTSSHVPFSWERHPGVPKNSFRSGGLASPTGTPLPLPPPLRAAPRRRRRRRRAKAPAHASAAAGSDPFVAAFAECTRDDDGEDDEEADHGAAKDGKLWLAPANPTVSGRAARPWRPATGGLFLGFLDLYGCKSAMAVADGALLGRRPVVAARRPGPASGRARR